ncbi:hypothetical protein M422DRAFT_37618, partial [Sphaerobolus stellatus SS14]
MALVCMSTRAVGVPTPPIPAHLGSFTLCLLTFSHYNLAHFRPHPPPITIPQQLGLVKKDRRKRKRLPRLHRCHVLV